MRATTHPIWFWRSSRALTPARSRANGSRWTRVSWPRRWNRSHRSSSTTWLRRFRAVVDWTRESRPVVVGVDATPDSDAALRWAVSEAALRERPLHVVASTAPAGRASLARAPVTSDEYPD